MKMKAYEKASSWLSKAKGMADEQLGSKIQELERQIESGQKAKALESGDGMSRESADRWKALWELDKSNSGYAFSALEGYISHKEYESALQLLDDPAFRQDQESAQLREALSQTPEMQQVRQYNDYVAQGDKLYGQKRFSGAIAEYKKALELHPEDPGLTAKIEDAEDEEAWSNALEENTLASIESYLHGNTLKNNREEARQIMRNSLLKFGEEYAIAGEVDKMELYLGKLKKSYASGAADLAYADDVMVRTYERMADGYSRSKSYSKLSDAADYYEKAAGLNPENSYQASIRATERRIKRYYRADFTYLAIVYDSITNVGISFGDFKNRKLGLYLTYRLDPDVFVSSASYNKKEDGTFAGPMDYTDIRSEGKLRTASMDAILGLTKKITYPLWIYFGGGVSYQQEWEELSMYSTSGELHQTDWVKLSDRESLAPMAEIGLALNLDKLHLRAGVKTSDFEKFENIPLSFGLGYNFR